MNHSKIIESPHYHLWTDALHARALARQSNNKWDRGTYTRWAVTTSWNVLEIACQEALNESSISYRFRENLDKAIQEKEFDRLDWGRGIWSSVLKLQNRRNKNVVKSPLDCIWKMKASIITKLKIKVDKTKLTVYICLYDCCEKN